MTTQAQAGARYAVREDLSKRAVALAMRSRWSEAIYVNQAILADFPGDVEAYNRLGKALTEEGRLREARDSFARVLDISPHNPIALRNLERLARLGDSEPAPISAGSVARRAFIEESGKSGVAPLINPGPAGDLLKEAPGHMVKLIIERGALNVYGVRGAYLGQVEPRLGSRLIKLMRMGNRYEAAVTSVGERQVAIIIRETFQRPSATGAVSFPFRRGGGHGAGVKSAPPGYDAGEIEDADQDEPVLVKDWSNDDTEPGDDEAFAPVAYRVINPAESQGGDL